MPSVNLDTEIFVYALTGGLNDFERQLLDTQECGISPVVYWELAMLISRRRLEGINWVDQRIHSLFERCVELPLTPTVAYASTQLDFDSDPADELIAATSVVYGMPLLTRDRKIRASKMVPLADARLLE